MTTIYKCSDCKKEFQQRWKGCKIIPKPLCPKCVIMNKVFVCFNCELNLTLKEGYLEECWICQEKGCSICLTIKKAKGITFGFCDKHKDYGRNKLNKDAEELLEEESICSSE